MTASNEKITEVIESYLALVADGTADQITALYADGATVEDPVGADVLTTREQIHAFYAGLEGMDASTRLLTARVAKGQAAFHFEIVTRVGDQTYTMSPIDVMTFDEEGRITTMRAFWSSRDMVVS